MRPGGSPRRGRWIRRVLLGRIHDSRDREEVVADLEELRRRRAGEVGSLRATLWYFRELLRYAWASRSVGSDGAPLLRCRSGSGDRIATGVESVWQDLRFTVRGFARAPGMVLVAVPTIALALGATTAIFSFADALLLRPLPVREPHRLLELWHVSTEEPRGYSDFS